MTNCQDSRHLAGGNSTVPCCKAQKLLCLEAIPGTFSSGLIYGLKYILKRMGPETPGLRLTTLTGKSVFGDHQLWDMPTQPTDLEGAWQPGLPRTESTLSPPCRLFLDKSQWIHVNSQLPDALKGSKTSCVS